MDIALVLVEIAGHWYDGNKAEQKSQELNRAIRVEQTAEHGRHPEGLIALWCEHCRRDGVILENHVRFHYPPRLAEAPSDVRNDTINFCPHCGDNEWPDWSPYLLRERELPEFLDTSGR
ncbi:hypothetical protein ACIQU3_36750 [Streptomyces sp. NPDC101110]|uniref:hypothetical protein n=1 Tax=Streptomyces sp. NPDC101110 TaxID=3366104 RepID=UPI003805B520